MNGTAYDKNGTVVICDKCENPAGYIVTSGQHEIRYCNEHSPTSQGEEASFVYRPPQCGTRISLYGGVDVSQVEDGSILTSNSKGEPQWSLPEDNINYYNGPRILNDAWVKTIRMKPKGDE